jgi:hypothetical protein
MTISGAVVVYHHLIQKLGTSSNQVSSFLLTEGNWFLQKQISKDINPELSVTRKLVEISCMFVEISSLQKEVK